MKRHLLSLVAVAAVASFAGAQGTTPARTNTHGDSVSATHRNANAGAKRKGTKGRRVTSVSRGAVDNGGPGHSARAVPRDWVRADDTSGDDLFRREQMMDQRCGKSRERCGKP